MIAQVRDVQKTIHEVQTEEMNMLGQFVVGSTIRRIPLSWKDFGISLKHKKNETKMENLNMWVRQC